MRIVSGKFRGRNLKAPSSNVIRPTSDRLRESIFNILLHAYADPITQARVLDLFAGTGALGLEAISRGADYALFVEEAAEARALARRVAKRTSEIGARHHRETRTALQDQCHTPLVSVRGQANANPPWANANPPQIFLLIVSS